MNYSVYCLLDPRNQTIFYVGCTCNPKQRINAHNCDPALPTYVRCREIKAAGLKVLFAVFKVFADREAALALENEIIHTFQGELLNRIGLKRKPKEKRDGLATD